MDFKEELPVWENEGVAPPKSKQEEGWKAGDKPPAAWFNWMQNRTYKSLQELRSKAQELGIDTDDIRYDVTELEKRINAELNKKADKSDVDTKLDKKADTSYVDDKISNIDINQFEAIYKGRHSFDTLKEPGVYRLWDSNTSPSRDIDDYITVVFSESAHTIQVAYSMITDSQRENRVYTRYSYLSSWTSWRELTNVEIEEELKTKANKEHTHSATDIRETSSRNFVTSSQLSDINKINDKIDKSDVDMKLSEKANKEHAHSANDITETVNRKFISLADKVKIDDIDDKADKSYVDTEIGKVPKVFHDKSIVTESRNPSWFDTGITICNQNTRDSFPTINEFGVSITFKGESSNYGQIFITTNGDIWSRRSNSSSSWRSWYSAKQEIDKKADKSEVDSLKQSGVESNRILVDALNSKKVSASTSDSIKTNVNKVKNIQVGDYSKGDLLPYSSLDLLLTTGGMPSGIFTKDITKPTAVAMTDNYIYVGTDSGRVYKLRLDGTTVWNKLIDSSSITAIDTDGDRYIYVGFENRYLRKINATTGSIVWSKQGGSTENVLTVKYKNNHIYLGARHKVSKISDSGGVVWAYQRVGYEPSQIDATENGIVVVISSSDHIPLMFNDKTGERISRSADGIGSGGGVFVGSSGVYLTDKERHFAKFNQDVTNREFRTEIPSEVLPGEQITKLTGDENGNFLYGISGNYVVKVSKWGGIVWRTWQGSNLRDIDYNSNLIASVQDNSVELFSSFAIRGAYLK